MLDIIDRSSAQPGDPGRADHQADDAADHVVLLDHRGRPSGTMPKARVHHASTPLHLAFSCHVVDDQGRALITRRAAAKRTWPGAWSNACCGHPRLGETLRQAVERRVAHELGCRIARMALVIDDFAYRAEMPDGVVEHELCPVVVAQLDGALRLDPAEADAFEWVEWPALRRRALHEPATLSPWSVEQITRLPVSAAELLARLDRSGRCLLDIPIAVPSEGHHRCSPATGALDAAVPGVDDALRTFLDARQEELAAIDSRAADLGRAIADLVARGGKRLRPAFVYWGWRAAGAGDGRLDGQRAVHVLGAAMELLHTFALLHDDVMDRSQTRRGRPAAHVAFAAAHRGRGMVGDAEQFGASSATLAGDLAFVWADQALDCLRGSEPGIQAARSVYSRLRAEVIAGQYLDLLAGSATLPTADEGPSGGSDEAALTVALLKSARYTVTRPLELGAALAGGGAVAPDTLAALAVYGDAIGLAFQMRDDVLDMFGDPLVTGKPAMCDLRDGKPTVLLGRALRLAEPADAERLRRSVGDRTLSDDEAARCREIVARSGALASVEALIAARHRNAVDALGGVDDAMARAALAELAASAVDRDT